MFCTRCGTPLPESAKSCIACGALARTVTELSLQANQSDSGVEKSHLRWIFVFLLGGLVVVASLWVITEESRRKAQIKAESQVISKGEEKSRAEFNFLSPRQHLYEAKKALNDGYRPNDHSRDSGWGRIEDARMHLAAIKADAKEYSQARELLHEVMRREREIIRINDLKIEKAKKEKAEAEREEQRLRAEIK